MLCLWGQVCWPVALALANPNNPQPAEGDLTLPMPHEANMVFRPVFIGKGKNPFFLHHFDMGDPSNDFKEHLTRVGDWRRLSRSTEWTAGLAVLSWQI